MVDVTPTDMIVPHMQDGGWVGGLMSTYSAAKSLGVLELSRVTDIQGGIIQRML